MKDIIAELEKAEAGSRELDRIIFELVKGRKRHISTFEQYESSEILPRYTVSIDAALILVPEGHEWETGSNLENQKGWAKVGDNVWDECFEDIVVIAATPALALCIAALKASEQ